MALSVEALPSPTTRGKGWGGGELLTDHFLFALPSISCILNGMRFGKLLRWVQRRVLPRRGLVDVA